MNKTVLICGSRSYGDRKAIRGMLLRAKRAGYDTVVEGEARGADRIAANEAEELGFEVKRFPAHWDDFGLFAGFRRNRQMLDEGKPGLVIYFSNDLANSKGTSDMVRRAHMAQVAVQDGGKSYRHPAFTPEGGV